MLSDTISTGRWRFAGRLAGISEDWARRRINSPPRRSAIRAGLRLLEEREPKLGILRRALVQGEQSGMANYSLDALNREFDEDLC